MLIKANSTLFTMSYVKHYKCAVTSGSLPTFDFHFELAITVCCLWEPIPNYATQNENDSCFFLVLLKLEEIV